MVESRGFVSLLGVAPWFFLCLWCMPNEPSLARGHAHATHVIMGLTAAPFQP